MSSGVNTSHRFLKARHFDELISEQHFGQITLKSGKATYLINSFEDGEFA